jgi:hypothetical protein
MSSISEIHSNCIPVFPFHHLTKIQRDSAVLKPSVYDGAFSGGIAFSFSGAQPLMSKDEKYECPSSAKTRFFDPLK